MADKDRDKINDEYVTGHSAELLHNTENGAVPGAGSAENIYSLSKGPTRPHFQLTS